MKKSILILIAAVSLLAYPAFGQVSVLGTSGSTTSNGIFDATISLQITGANSITNVESLNMLLKTFTSSGHLSGSGLFTVQFLAPIPPFTLGNNPSGVASFNTAGDANNSGTTVSSTSVDLGASAPMASSAPVASSGTTTFAVETLRFTALNAPAGIYNFSATLGGFADAAQGTYINNSSNAHFDVTGVPTFTITIAAIPEPATWSLLGLGGLGAFGLNLLRFRRRV